MTRADSITANSRRKRSIVDAVSRRYDLGSLRRTERLTGGVLNEVYLTETSHGEFVIRVNRVRRSIAEIERLSTFLSHLRYRAIPADELVSTVDGRVAAEMDGELLSVHRFIPGTVYASPAVLSGSQTANLMRFLAHYHSAAGEYRTDGGLAARDEMLPVMYTDDPDRLRGRLKRLPKMAKVEASAVNRAIDRLASFFVSGEYRELTRTWVHGDFRSCNVAFDADRVIGLFDWDLLCRSPRLWDVVVASSDLARAIAGPFSRSPRVWVENCTSHLAVYRTEARRRGADMTESEVRSIPYMLLADAMVSGAIFALHLRQLPLKPGESASQRRRRSDRLLAESVADLATIDSMIANGDATLSRDT